MLETFKANPDIVISEVDRQAFVEATAPVLDIWKGKPFGDFVSQIAAAARG